MRPGGPVRRQGQSFSSRDGAGLPHTVEERTRGHAGSALGESPTGE